MRPTEACRLLRALLICAVLGFASGAPGKDGKDAQPGPRTQYRDALRLLDHWLDAQVALDRVPALSAGVVIGQDLVWHKGYGTIDTSGKVPASSGTIYSVCSISKLFTSIAVMQLWEAGKLSLDDDLGKHIADFAIRRTDPDSGPITIRSVLTHSSGLPRESPFQYWSLPDFRFPSRDEMLKALAAQSTFMGVSDHFQYSNLAMALLGEVVASASGTTYDEYVARNILAPLKLTDTRTTLPVELFDKRLARGYGAMRRNGARDALKSFDTRGLAAAAGFTSTVEDLARFASWQFRLRKSGGSEVLRVHTLREMHRVQWIDPDGSTSWGLGFSVAREGKNTVVGHTGHCPGYRTAIALSLKDEIGVIALANANGAGPYTKPMRDIMHKGLRLPEAKRGAGNPELESFAGHYDMQPWGHEAVVVPWGSDLAMLSLPARDPAGDLRILRHTSGDTFRLVRKDESLGAEVSFDRDSTGSVTGYTTWSHFYPRIRR